MARTFDPVAALVLVKPLVRETALAMATTLLIDTIGISAGAGKCQVGEIVRDYAASFMAAGANQSAVPILFDGRKASAPGAVFAMASQIDNLDAHNGLNRTKGHIACAVVPAFICFAEDQPDLSGHDAFKALVMSCEIAARDAVALHETANDYHVPISETASSIGNGPRHKSGLAADPGVCCDHSLGRRSITRRALP